MLVKYLTIKILIINTNGGRWQQFEEHYFNITYNKSQGNAWIQKFFQINGINDTHNSEISMQEFKHLFNLGKIGYIRNAVQTYLDAFVQHSMEMKECDLANVSCDPLPIRNHKRFSEEFIQHIF